MITKHININYNYPIHIYFDNEQMDGILKNNTIIEDEIHVYYANSRLGSCHNVSCLDCPIFKECSNDLNLYRLIPNDIKNEYPELFI